VTPTPTPVDASPVSTLPDSAVAAAVAPSWILDFTILAAIWGSSFLFMHLGAVEFGALPTAGVRVAIAAAFLLPLLAFKGQAPLLRQHWKHLLAVGIMNSAIPFTCLSFALLTISTGLSSLLNATVPLFGAAVAWVWLKDRPGSWRVVGLLIGFCGVALLATNKASFQPQAAGLPTGWAVLACLVACFFYGFSASFARRYLAKVPSLVLATGSQVGAAIGLAPLAWWFWPDQAVSAKAWLAVLALGVVCTGIAYILYFRLIERIGPAKALAVTFAVPVFAVLYGVVLLGEVVTPWMAGCGLVILLGTSLSTGVVGPRKK
jgi:drug/metabolite transporter (DMT)-like permease